MGFLLCRESKREKVLCAHLGVAGEELEHDDEDEGEEEAVGEEVLAAADVNGAGPNQTISREAARKDRREEGSGWRKQAHAQDIGGTAANFDDLTIGHGGTGEARDGQDRKSVV